MVLITAPLWTLTVAAAGGWSVRGRKLRPSLKVYIVGLTERFVFFVRQKGEEGRQRGRDGAKHICGARFIESLRNIDQEIFGKVKKNSREPQLARANFQVTSCSLQPVMD